MSRWEPIDYLPGAAEYIESNLGILEGRLSMYRIAQGKPHAIDDQALHKGLALHRQALLDAQAPDAQLARWLSESLTPTQRMEVRRLVGQMEKWREVCRATFEVVEELLRLNASQLPDPLAAAAFYVEMQCRPYASLSPLVRGGLPFVLPPEVTVTCVEADEEQRVYRFEHRDLGFLGQLRAARAPGGVLADAWVNDSTGRLSRQRRVVFTELTERLMGLLGAAGIRAGR